MSYSRKVRGVALALALTAALAAPALAADLSPQPMQSGDVTYITGGFGTDEKQALEAQAHNYNLAITNANQVGEYAANTALTIRSASGTALQVEHTGPLFYAKLPPGNYQIDATHDGQSRTRQVTVPASGSANISLIWPRNG